MKLLFASLLFLGPTAFAAESYEACTYEGPCALRVTDTETKKEVWLVTESSVSIMQIWEGTFWLVSESDYDGVRDMIPESQRFTVPGKNPTTGQRLEATKPAPKPTGSPSPSVTGGGPLIGGSITVNVGDGNPCAPCHTGSMREIHKKVLNDGGK